MAVAEKNKVRFTKAPIKTKVKMGGTTLVSEALVKSGATNLVPKIHVKKGDLVMVVSGPRKNRQYRDAALKKRAEERNAFRGTTGKVLNVFPKTGEVIVEGVNIITRATKSRSPMAKSRLIRKEAPIHASKVMLYCTDNKKPVRAEFRKKLGLD